MGEKNEEDEDVFPRRREKQNHDTTTRGPTEAITKKSETEGLNLIIFIY